MRTEEDIEGQIKLFREQIDGNPDEVAKRVCWLCEYLLYWVFDRDDENVPPVEEALLCVDFFRRESFNG